MQHLNLKILNIAKKEKIQKLEEEMKKIVSGYSKGEIFVCPFCNYSSRKNSKGSAKSFGDSFKCFNCGIWRVL